MAPRTELWPADVTETWTLWALTGAGLVVSLVGLAQFGITMASSSPFLADDATAGDAEAG